jgi:hypothetical protein
MRWAILLLFSGIFTMANFTPQDLSRALMQAQASSVTPTEEEQMRTDPSFNDWVRTYQGRIRGGASREDVIREHRQKWPETTIHEGEGYRSGPNKRAKSKF